ncbi:MAG TPA: GH25 family lysozyme [Syntrophomonas sp.]|nr:GH25 family lysozyme [Syntrophomonas sp.]
MTMKGIDISSYQPSVDFTKVAAAGIEVVYIKATEGTGYTNPYLKTHAAAAQAASLKVGFYHYMTPKSAANAVEQAKYFINTINGLAYDCKLTLDLEVTGNLDKATLNTVAKAFLEQVAALTETTPVLYSYTSFIKTYLTKDLTTYPLWVADYRSGAPGVNSVWTDWIGWQYSSTGAVAGINGNVDLDTFTDDILLNDNTVYFKALEVLVYDNVIKTVEYWQNAATSNTDVNGEYMATVIMRMTNQSTLADGVAVLVSAGAISTPDYWLANAVASKTCKIQYVKKLVVDGVKKLQL